MATGSNSLGQSLVPLVNRLQDIFGQAGIPTADLDLPQVAVVGCQSSGKSSVLEALVGRDFLPRGTEICTRRPLVLQLVYTPAQPGRPIEWGEFLHRPGELFTDFEHIRQEIQAETDRVTGVNKGVSEKQIRLKICSPHVLTMTLVDLPGIARVPVGDQPQDIEARIASMILSYISRDSCLILAVTPGNSDLAASDALKLARQVDPEGRRTIGVITKLDIMDRGTNAVHYIKGEIVPLSLGYIGVINRCQEDIMRKRSIREALASEAAFFQSHPEYSQVASHCGTHALSHTVSSVLAEHIRTLLPSLVEAIVHKRNAAAAELMAVGDTRPETSSAQGAFLLQVLHKYATGVSAVVGGSSESLTTTELAGGARIHFILHEIFVKGVMSLDPTSELSDDDIRTAIQNAAGTKGVILIPEEPFELLAKQSISKMLEPCRRCVTLVHEELVRIVRRCIGAEVKRYPALEQALEEQTRRFLEQGAEPAEHMIQSLVDCQLAYIDTSHPEFVGGSAAIRLAQDEVRRERCPEEAQENAPGSTLKGQSPGGATPSGATPRTPLGEANGRAQQDGAVGKARQWVSGLFGGKGATDRHNATYSLENGTLTLHEPPAVLRATEPQTDEELLQVKVTRILLNSYFTIARSALADTVPKAVVHFLVNSVSRGLQQHLISTLYRENMFEAMLQEVPELAEYRKRAKERLNAMNLAIEAMGDIPEQLKFVNPI